MKSYTEIKKIAVMEAEHEDSIYDIDNEDFSRKNLWISAFCVGYEIAQYNQSLETDGQKDGHHSA